MDLKSIAVMINKKRLENFGDIASFLVEGLKQTGKKIASKGAAAVDWGALSAKGHKARAGLKSSVLKVGPDFDFSIVHFGSGPPSGDFGY